MTFQNASFFYRHFRVNINGLGKFTTKHTKVIDVGEFLNMEKFIADIHHNIKIKLDFSFMKSFA